MASSDATALLANDTIMLAENHFDPLAEVLLTKAAEVRGGLSRRKVFR